MHRRSITQRTTGTERKLMKKHKYATEKRDENVWDHVSPVWSLCYSCCWCLHELTLTHRRLEVAERKNSEFGVAGNWFHCFHWVPLYTRRAAYCLSYLLPKLLTTFQSTTSQLASLPSQATYFYSKIDYGQWPPRIHGALLLMLLLQADRSTHSSINTYMLLNTCASSWGL